MGLEQLYYEKLSGLGISDIQRQINDYFIACGREYKRGIIDEATFYSNTYSFSILPAILRKKYSTELKAFDNSRPSFPLRIVFDEWKATGEVTVENWMDDFIVSETDMKATMLWFYQVIELLRIPISCFDSLNLPKEKIMNISMVSDVSDENHLLLEMTLEDRCINEDDYYKSSPDIGKKFSLKYLDEYGETYSVQMEKEYKEKALPAGAIYFCTAIFEKGSNRDKQKVYFVDTPHGLAIVFNPIRIEASEVYQYLINSKYYPIIGDYWHEFNEARFQKGLRVEAEYKALRYGCYEKSRIHYWDNWSSNGVGASGNTINSIEELPKVRAKEMLGEDANKKARLKETIVEKRVQESIQKLSEYHLAEVSADKLRGYFRYLLLEEKKEKAYHFFVQTDSQSSGIGFSIKLLNITEELGKKAKKYLIVSEWALVHQTEDLIKRLDEVDSIIITDPLPDDKYYPIEDITSSENGDRRQYDTFWNRFMKDRKDKTILFCVPKDIISGRIKSKSKLFYHFFRPTIIIENMSEDEIVSAMLQRTAEEIGPYSEEFEKELKEYIYTVYKKADLKNRDFIDDLFDWMVDLSYEKNGNCRSFTKESIPFYHRNKSLDMLEGEFQKLVGLEEVKETFRDIGILCRSITQGRDMPYMHMVFRGNSGTGKTTVARKAAKMFSDMGIINKNYVHEVSATDLLGKYRGHTGPKVKDVFKKAEGGILFIDDADLLYDPDSTDSFRMEAVGNLISGMDKKNNPIVILSGLDKNMGGFLKGNPSLGSRIGYDITFRDYEDKELIEIFKQMCEESDYGYDNKTIKAVQRKIVSMRYEEDFGNARSVETIFTQSKIESLKRNQESHFISEKDIIITRKVKKYEELRQELDSLIGIEDAKKTITEQVISNKFAKESNKNLLFANHMVFVGNPGTGKTTTARLFSEILFSIGVAKSPRTKLITAKELYVEDSAKKLNEFCKEALGGVLFIDEIYMLSSDTYRLAQVVSVLLELLEDKKGELTVILAGYEKQMESFLNENPGLKSRFPITVRFSDFTEEELCRIFIQYCEKSKMRVDEAGLNKFREVINAEMKKDNFGNGRTVRNIYEHAFRRHAVNYYNDEEKVDRDVITAEDIEELVEVNERKIGKLGFN